MKTEMEFCPAKINLFLEVLDKRSDGYHNIDTVMQSLTLSDIVTVKQISDGIITITSDSDAVPCDETNICYKAAKAYADYFGIENFGLNIHIEKKIPIAAGLGGGSSDGAGVLRALNKIYKKASDGQLNDIASSVGADVAFFLKNVSAKCEGIGEIITPCTPMPSCYILLAKGDEGVSAGYAYRVLDENERERKDSQSVLDSLLQKKLEPLCRSLYNAFEEVILQNHVKEQKAKEIMLAKGAAAALMSGSGPCVYGIFKKGKDAENAAKEIKAEGLDTRICRPLRKLA